MKKNVVIYAYTMEMGGAEVALINILNLLKDKYNIDLILLEKKGVLLDKVPSTVNVKEIKTNIFKYILFRFFPIFRKKIINKLSDQKYDLAIAFIEGRAATFLMDLNQNCKKIAWIHTDVAKYDIGISELEIKKTYNNVDKVIAVSKHAKNSFCNKFSIPDKQVDVIYNLIDEKSILEKSKELKPKKEKFTFINVAKMRVEKRHDRLIEAAKILKEEGFDFKLWLVGNGPLEEEIKELIKKYDVSDKVDLLGLKTNPFPYIKAADYFVMSSDHEGYPISLLESLTLKTKIITTDVSGAREMLGNDQFGYIVENSLEGIVNKMREVMINKDLSKNIEKNLKNYKGSNDKIRKQLLKLFDIDK